MTSRYMLSRIGTWANIRFIAVLAVAIVTVSAHLSAQPADVEQRQPEDNSAGQDSDEGVTLDALRKRYMKKQKDVQAQTEAIQVLAEHLGTLNNETIAKEQRIRLQELRSTKRELDRLRRSLNEAIAELTLLQIHAQFGTAARSEHLIQDELEKDAEFLSLSYQISELKDQHKVQSKTLRPGSPALNQIQQEIRYLQRKQVALREGLMPKVAKRLKSALGESDLDRQKARLMQRATVQQLTNQIKVVEKTYYRQLAEYLELGGSSGDLEARMAELEELRRELDLVRGQLKALESEDDQVAAPRDVRTIVQRMRILLDELEKAVSEHHDRPTKSSRAQP